MILVCPRCNAQYEARLKDPSKPPPKGKIKVQCLACGNPYLGTEGSFRQDAPGDILGIPEESERLNGKPLSSWKGRGEDRDSLPDFPSFDEIEEPFGMNPSDEEVPRQRFSPRPLLFSVFLVSLFLGVAIGGVALYRAFLVHSPTQPNPRLVTKAPGFNTEARSSVPFDALSFEHIHVEKRRNRSGETFTLVRGRVKNLGTLSVHERVRCVVRAYAKNGQLKEEKATLLGNDIPLPMAEEGSVFELIARSELPSPDGMVVPLEPKESLPFGLVFPDDGATIGRLNLSIETGP